MNDDTIKLLRECNAGIKMGVASLDDVLDHVKDERLKRLLLTSKDTHSRLGDKTHGYLLEYQEEGKEPGMMVKVKDLAKELIRAEETLLGDLREYL